MWQHRLLLAFLVWLIAVPALATTITRVTKPSGGTAWQTGDQVTATDLNGDFDAIVTVVNGNLDENNLPDYPVGSLAAGGAADGAFSITLEANDIDDYSADEAEANNDTAPSVSGTPALATNVEGEIENLRYGIRRATTGINVQRNDNGSMTAVDWWELPVRGPNLITNGQFGVGTDDGAGNVLADGWTLVDGDADATMTLVANSEPEGGGYSQDFVAGDNVGDGFSQTVDGLKASTRYLFCARAKSAVDTIDMTIAGPVAGEWQAITAGDIQFSSGTYEIKCAVVETDAVPANLVISFLSTAGADDWNVADVAAYELSEDFVPSPSPFASYVEVNTKQDCDSGAWADITDLTTTVMPRNDGSIVVVDAIVTLYQATGGKRVISIRLDENGSTVAGPVTQRVHDGANTGHVITLHYVNPAPTPGTALVYQVEYIRDSTGIDCNHAQGPGGQTASSIRAVVHQ